MRVADRKTHKGEKVIKVPSIHNFMCNKCYECKLRLNNSLVIRIDRVIQENQILNRNGQNIHHKFGTWKDKKEIKYSENRTQGSMEPKAFPEHSNIEVYEEHGRHPDEHHKEDVKGKHQMSTSNSLYYSYLLSLSYSVFHTCTSVYFCNFLICMHIVVP